MNILCNTRKDSKLVVNVSILGPAEVIQKRTIQDNTTGLN